MYTEKKVNLTIKFYNNSMCKNYIDKISNNYQCNYLTENNDCCKESIDLYYKYLYDKNINLDKCYNFKNRSFEITCDFVEEYKEMSYFIYLFVIAFACIFYLSVIYLLFRIIYNEYTKYDYLNNRDNPDERIIILKKNPLYESFDDN